MDTNTATSPVIMDDMQIEAVNNSPQILKSPLNIFGIFRQYYARDFPLHDPGELVTLHEMWDASSSTSTQITGSTFGLYPNQSSFLLGKWFWSEGVQKSKRSFKELVDIIGGLNSIWATFMKQIGTTLIIS
jgi:hypothetical protein